MPLAENKGVCPNSPDDLARVCLDELHLARFSCKVPIVPIMAVSCPPSFVIYGRPRTNWLPIDSPLHGSENGMRGLRDACPDIEKML